MFNNKYFWCAFIFDFLCFLFIFLFTFWAFFASSDRRRRYIRYRNNIGYPRDGERYNIGDNQYSSKNLSYCPINRFLESVPFPKCNSQWLLRKAALMRFFLSDLHWQALVWGCHSNQISRTKSLWVPRNVTVVPTWKGENPSIAQNFRVRCSLNERTGSVFHINLV